MISQRTKEGLRAAKARGVVLGANSAALNKRHVAEADGRAHELAELIRQIPDDQRQTITSLTHELNARKIPTTKGGAWHRQTVYRLLERMDDLGVVI